MKECLAFTTGGFLYFSINGLLSELKEVKSVSTMVGCFIANAAGLYLMYVFALFDWSKLNFSIKKANTETD